MKLLDLIEGKVNRKLKTEIPQNRLDECIGCEFNVPAPISQLIVIDGIAEISGNICEKCSCPLPDKLRVTSEKCPIGKW